MHPIMEHDAREHGGRKNDAPTVFHSAALPCPALPLLPSLSKHNRTESNRIEQEMSYCGSSPQLIRPGEVEAVYSAYHYYLAWTSPPCAFSCMYSATICALYFYLIGWMFAVLQYGT